MKHLTLGLAMLASLLAATSAFAVTGDVTAQCNVLTPISVSTNLRDLDFGDVLPGVTYAVDFDDANSGKWQVSGVAGAEVDVAFTLPTNLTDGGNNLAITFDATSAGWHTSDAPASGTSFDPAAGTTQNLDGATGDLFLWIGGEITPSGTQTAGTYSATITVDVNYTGN